MNMNETQKPDNARPNDHLANERTFLAWIRTSLALMGFGFVVAKSALFLHRLGLTLQEVPSGNSSNDAVIAGIIMVAMGAVVAVWSYIRFLNVEKQLRNNTYHPSGWLTAVLAFFAVAVSVVLAVYLLG